jgi:putative hydrolase of the HAD superfamily
MMSREIAGVILDAVGTLIEPAPAVASVYAEAARRQGLDLDVREIKRRFARSFRDDEVDEQRGPLATDEATEHRRWRRIVADVLPDLPDPERGFSELWDHFGRASAWRAFEDVATAIDGLRRSGLKYVIASNFDGRLRAVVRGLPGLAGAEASLVISSEVGVRKPHPDFYRAACERLGLPPDRVLCVGDDVENDVLGARRAGLHAVLLDRTGGRRREGIVYIERLDGLTTSPPTEIRPSSV